MNKIPKVRRIVDAPEITGSTEITEGIKRKIEENPFTLMPGPEKAADTNLPIPEGLPETRFLIFSGGYNCGLTAKKNIESIHGQNYQNFTHIIVNDASTDMTDSVIKYYLPRYGSRISYYKNFKNVGLLQNMINYIKPNIKTYHDVIIIVDFDDWLPNSDVFKTINYYYQKYNYWLTYGSYRAVIGGNMLKHKGKQKGQDVPIYSKSTLQYRRDFRVVAWMFYPIRTFKAFLWLNVNPEDLRGPKGTYKIAGGDRAYGYPLLELTPGDKIGNIPEVLYIYNSDSPLCDHRVHAGEQSEMKRWFSRKPRYTALDINYPNTLGEYNGQ
jgi:glycosyltransferase involved in cell wall biosynthesis